MSATHGAPKQLQYNIKITDHHTKYNNEIVWNVMRISKMWHRDTEWANTVQIRICGPTQGIDTNFPFVKNILSWEA